MSDEILRAYVCVDCGFNEGESPQAGCCRRCGATSHECDIVDFASLSKVRERLHKAMYIEEGDDPAILEAALASVEWVNGAPHLDELQHAIGTFVEAVLA